MGIKKVSPIKRSNPHAISATLIATLEIERDQLARDYSLQSGALRTATASIAVMSEQLTSFDRVNDDANVIAMFYRTEMRAEIESGKHQNRTLGEITIAYLGELRKLQSKLNAKPGWVRFLLGV